MTDSTNQRIEYIDVAKFIAMVLVVFAHGFKEGTAVAFIFSFHLPVFFFLNGMTLKMEGFSFGDFLVKKLKSYILPMFGLSVLTILLNTLVKSILDQAIPDNFFISNLAKAINQHRFFAVWFLPVLFFVDLMMYGLHRLFKKNLGLMGVGSLAILGIGLLFNHLHNVVLVWNFDASLFGIIFTYFGFAFKHNSLSKIYKFLTKSRWLAGIVGICLLSATYAIATYSYDTNHHHLEMFFRIYKPYYIVLPCALIGCFGFTLFCRGISNFILAKPVAINLVLLPLHQEFAFPLFRGFIAKEWWHQVAALQPTDISFILFAIAMTLFSIATAGIIYFIVRFSPLSFITNKPLAHFYSKIGQRKLSVCKETSPN